MATAQAQGPGRHLLQVLSSRPLLLMHLVFGLLLQPPPLVQGLGGCSPRSWACALLLLLRFGHLESGFVVVFAALFVALLGLAQVGLCLLLQEKREAPACSAFAPPRQQGPHIPTQPAGDLDWGHLGGCVPWDHTGKPRHDLELNRNTN